MRYFITFACYGGHLHGDESGSVDRNHNLPGGRLLEADPYRVAAERQSMTQTQYLLDRDSRAVVLQALLEVCSHRGWGLLAAHVRTHHVHAVVEAEVRPEKIMNDFQSYASRGWNQLGRDGSERKRWARQAREARDGSGRIRKCSKRSGMSSRSRANPWRSSSLSSDANISSLTVTAQQALSLGPLLCR